jgi:hypothetical protein
VKLQIKNVVGIMMMMIGITVTMHAMNLAHTAMKGEKIMGRTIRHCTNCQWSQWHEPNHECFECEPTGSGPSNFLWNKGKQIAKGITEKEYRKEKLDDNF